MLAKTFLRQVLLTFAQIAFTLVLSAVLGYCVVHLEPVRGFFRSEWGSNTYRWFLRAMGSQDLANVLGTFTLIWLSMTPSLAVWICVLLTRYLRRKASPVPSAEP
ncbi:hypothetical protein N5D61_18710 [Pseudomonas sp. GD03842]|uniref:hypothetical protein n=1 Tax=Pseudomonas sp. GD03842 TaxID=2975385 RepID=UPI002447E439|nr:hypothetical protein [Pseudomonas sp. GD03842]MDH0748357.1 hypothetical protein [Pseudomonas sp. GD03842]